jgi:hypothetical protein
MNSMCTGKSLSGKTLDLPCDINGFLLCCAPRYLIAFEQVLELFEQTDTVIGQAVAYNGFLIGDSYR